MSQREFCPYRGADVEQNLLNDEHVIPETLGGMRATVIRVEMIANGTLGSEVDGPVVDQLFGHHRLKFDLRGHSGRAPRIEWPVSVPAAGDQEGRFSVTAHGAVVKLRPLVTRERQVDGTERITVSGNPEDALRIFAEIRKASEAKGKTVTVDPIVVTKLDQPRITGSVAFDILAIARFPVKVALGMGHLWGGSAWSRGPTAATLRKALWAKSVAEFEASGAEIAHLRPATLGMRVEPNEHVFVLTQRPGTKAILSMLFFGHQGWMITIDREGGDLARLAMKTVLLNVENGALQDLSTADLMTQDRVRLPEPD